MNHTGRSAAIHRMFALARPLQLGAPFRHVRGRRAMIAIAVVGAAMALVFLVTTVLLVESERRRAMEESAFKAASFKQALAHVRKYCLSPMPIKDWLLYANIFNVYDWRLRPDNSDKELIEYLNPDPSTARRLRQLKKYEIVKHMEKANIPGSAAAHDLSRYREEDRLARDAAFHALLKMGHVEKADTKLLEPSTPVFLPPLVLQDLENELHLKNEFQMLHELSLFGHCSWTFWKRPAPSSLRLIGSLFWLAGYQESRFDPDDSIHNDLFGNLLLQKLGWKYRDTVYWNAWRGTYHFTFTHPKAEYPLSVWIPVSSGSAFLQRVMILFLGTWAALMLALGAVLAWWVLKPLRTLARSARAAGRIVEADDGVPDKLKSLADGLPSRTDAFREMKVLLHSMSSLLEERERWMGDVVHQLKNNLAVFSVNLRKLRAAGNGDAAGPFGPELEEIDKAADMISGTLKSVEVYQWALFGRPEEKARLELDSMLDTIADEIEDLGGEISISYAGRRPLNMYGRRTALMSALQNLIRNAHLHGGAIEVRVELTDGDTKAVITIDDDGPGIDDDIDEIFKPYRQGRKPRGHGAGLGLAIAAGVISDHGGDIAVSNREAADGSRAGLRVWVALPLNVWEGLTTLGVASVKPLPLSDRTVGRSSPGCPGTT